MKVLEQTYSTKIEKMPERIYLFKSSYRNQYHREILDILAYPQNHIIEVTYDKKHVQDDLFFHMSILPNSYKNKKGVWIYVDTKNIKLTPIREIEIINLKEAGGVISAKIKLGRYISFPMINGDDLEKQFTYAFKCYFGSNNIPPGGKYILIGESFIDMLGYPYAGSFTAVASQAFPTFKGKLDIGNEFGHFHTIVPCLVADKKMKRSVFYRIELNNVSQTQLNDEVLYKVASGSSFTIDFGYFLPNYSEFSENNPAERTVCFDCSSKIVEPIGPTKIICSKYGHQTIFFKAKKIRDNAKVAITFWNENDEFRAAKITINIEVVPQTTKEAALSMIAALLFTLGTSGSARYVKAVEQNESVWSSFLYSVKSFFWQPPDTLISNIIYIFFLGLVFFGVSWFLAKGIKPAKLP